MAVAWTAKINSVVPSGANLIISIGYYLTSDSSFTSLLGGDSLVVPNTTTVLNAKAQILAQAQNYRTSYDLVSGYAGTTVSVP